MNQSFFNSRKRLIRTLLLGMIACVAVFATASDGFAQGRNDLQARNRRARIENQRKAQQQFQQARLQQIARQQQFYREQQAQLNAYVLDRYYSVQDLWIVQMTLPNGYRFYQPYLGRTSGHAQIQARRQYPYARIDFIRRFDFRG